MKFSENSLKIKKAIFAVKKELKSVAKTSNNPFFKSKYADLNAHLDVAEPLLEQHGCFIVQGHRFDGVFGKTVGVTQIIHAESGEWYESEMELVMAKNDMQNLGACSTYSRRFNLSAMLAMKAEDDDGNSASAKETKKSTQVETELGFDKPATKEAPKASGTITEAIKKAPSFKRPTKPTEDLI